MLPLACISPMHSGSERAPLSKCPDYPKNLLSRKRHEHKCLDVVLTRRAVCIASPSLSGWHNGATTLTVSDLQMAAVTRETLLQVETAHVLCNPASVRMNDRRLYSVGQPSICFSSQGMFHGQLQQCDRKS